MYGLVCGLRVSRVWPHGHMCAMWQADERMSYLSSVCGPCGAHLPHLRPTAHTWMQKQLMPHICICYCIVIANYSFICTDFDVSKCLQAVKSATFTMTSILIDYLTSLIVATFMTEHECFLCLPIMVYIL